MTNKIQLLPSQHEFSSEKNETLLEAALRSGLSVDYGCSNGACGKCKAKIISGKIEKSGFQDFVFSEAEKLDGQILLCCSTALTDAILETSEASTTEEIPLQRIKVKIKKIESVAENVIILHTRTPRSQRLRYISGQRVRLINNKNDSLVCSIASCPCDALNQQFHIAIDPDNKFISSLIAMSQGHQDLEIEGPSGSFVLQEKSVRPIMFIAYETGFGPIKGLIEHALSLELTQDIHLLWIAEHLSGHYMHNYCRSISDAVDNFYYTPVTLFDDSVMNEHSNDVIISSQLSCILENLTSTHPDLEQYDIYVSGHVDFIKPGKSLLLKSAADPSHILTEPFPVF